MESATQMSSQALSKQVRQVPCLAVSWLSAYRIFELAQWFTLISSADPMQPSIPTEDANIFPSSGSRATLENLLGSSPGFKAEMGNDEKMGHWTLSSAISIAVIESR